MIYDQTMFSAKTNALRAIPRIGVRGITQNYRSPLVSSLLKPINSKQTIRSRLDAPCAKLSYNKPRCGEEPQKRTRYADKISNGMVLAGGGTLLITICGGALLLIDIWLQIIAKFFDVPILYVRLWAFGIPTVLFVIGFLF